MTPPPLPLRPFMPSLHALPSRTAFPFPSLPFPVALFAAAAEDEGALKEGEKLSCEPCKKLFSSNASYDQHVASKKHALTVKKAEEQAARRPVNLHTVAADESRAAGAAAGEDMEDGEDGEGAAAAAAAAGRVTKKKISKVARDVAEGESKDGDAMMTEVIIEGDIDDWDPKQCLFCSTQSKDIDSNMAHMLKNHGFFVPDVEYLTDIEGLLTYLGAKISLGHICLYCTGRGKT